VGVKTRLWRKKGEEGTGRKIEEKWADFSKKRVAYRGGKVEAWKPAPKKREKKGGFMVMGRKTGGPKKIASAGRGGGKTTVNEQ